jgi:hypothetical protein
MSYHTDVVHSTCIRGQMTRRTTLYIYNLPPHVKSVEQVESYNIPLEKSLLRDEVFFDGVLVWD